MAKCPMCKRELRYIEKYRRFFCDPCERYLDEMVDENTLLLSNIDHIPRMEVVKTLGIAKGSSVYTKNFGEKMGAIGDLISGGEVSTFLSMLIQARDIAIHRMVMDGYLRNADAIINVRLQTSMIEQQVSEVIAYGTAVKTRPLEINGRPNLATYYILHELGLNMQLLPLLESLGIYNLSDLMETSRERLMSIRQINPTISRKLMEYAGMTERDA